MEPRKFERYASEFVFVARGANINIRDFTQWQISGRNRLNINGAHGDWFDQRI